MSLAEADESRDRPTQAANRNLSRGNGHSKRIKDALRFNRLCRKHASELFSEQLALATNAESEAIRASTGQYLLNRAFGMPASAPEDQAVALAVASAPSQFLAQLLQMRSAAIQRQIIDATPDATPALNTSDTTKQNQ